MNEHSHGQPPLYQEGWGDNVAYVSRAARFIRDAIVERVTAVGSAWPGSPIVTVRKVQQPPLLPQQLPAVSVFTLRETAPAKGDYRAMIPLNYDNTSIFNIDVARGFEDPVYLQGGLETDVLFIKTLLLTDVTLFARRWPGALSEGVKGVNVSYRYEQQGETYFAIGTLEFSVGFQEPYVPIITDRLNEIEVKLRGFDAHLLPKFDRRWDMTTKDHDDDDEN